MKGKLAAAQAAIKLSSILTVFGAVALANSVGAETLTYQIEFTNLNSTIVGGLDFFEATGINRVDTVSAMFTFDDEISSIFPENYSGAEYIYDESYTPWSSLSLEFGSTVIYAFPSGDNPYTSIRVRDGISEGTGYIGDLVFLDAEFDYVSPNGYEFTNALISIFIFDESTFSGTEVQSIQTLNLLRDGDRYLNIGTIDSSSVFGPRLYAANFTVSDVTAIPR